nr:unnamed protein product [Digitaria exilis]
MWTAATGTEGASGTEVTWTPSTVMDRGDGFGCGGGVEGLTEAAHCCSRGGDAASCTGRRWRRELNQGRGQTMWWSWSLSGKEGSAAEIHDEDAVAAFVREVGVVRRMRPLSGRTALVGSGGSRR